MAEEDILYGKNRHFFGGMAPSNMIEFAAISVTTEDVPVTVKIIATLPNNTVLDGHTLCTVGGAVIRKSTTGFPKDEFDGEEFANITESCELVDEEAVVGKTYYYAAFPYSKQGVYNRNKANRASLTPDTSYGYFFGYDLDIEDSNPSTRITYPINVQNANYEPAYMDYDAGTFNYGDWPSEAGEKFMPKPCIIYSSDGTKKYLNPNDNGKYLDGTAASGSNALMEWPKIYTKRWEEDGVYHFRCCDIKLDDDYECWCNRDINDAEIDHFYTGIYLIVEASSTGYIYSRTGATPSKLSYGADWTYNQIVEKGITTDQITDRMLVNDLLVMMAKTTNCRAAYGVGYNLGGTITTGRMNTKGMFWGDKDGSVGVKVFGMEDWWSGTAYYNYWRIVTGWYCYAGVQKIQTKPTDGKFNGFTSTGIAYPATKNSAAYITKMKTYPWGRIPQTGGGSLSTYDCHYAGVNSDAGGTSTAPAGHIISGVGSPYGVYVARSIVGGSYRISAGMSYRPKKS